MNRTVCLLMTATLVAVAGGHTLAQPHGDGLLFAGVDMVGLMERVGVPAQRLGADSRAVWYSPGKREEGLTSEALIGVFQTIDQARNAFNGLAVTPEMGRRLEGDTIGDECLYWSRAGQGLKRLMFRRENLVLSFMFIGPDAAMIAQGKEIDGILLTEPGIAPRGIEVPVPSLEITVPEPVLAAKRAWVSVNVIDGPRVELVGHLFWRTADMDEPQFAYLHDFAPGFSSEVSAALSLPNPGQYALELTFATEGNTVFTRTCKATAVSRAQWPEHLPLGWEIMGESLHFLPSADAEWGRRSGHQEWLDFGRGGSRIPAGAKTLRQQALDEIARVVKERWLPSVEFLQPVEERAVQPRILCRASYTVRGCRIIYMGVLGRQVFLYIEQSDPLPEGQRPLTRADVLRDDLLQIVADEHGATSYPRVQFVAREMRRYRALSDFDEPYEPVHILLVDARLPDDVNLRSPGYE